MSTIFTLMTKLAVDASGFKSELDKSEGQASGWASNVGGFLKKAVPVAAIVGGIAAVGKGLLDAGKAAAEEEAGIAKLAASVAASGGSWAEAEGAIESYLAAQLRRTALDDGAGREAISTLTNMTGDYKEALNLMGLAQDMAAAKSIDLNTAAEIVGKVYAGNTGTLTRYGIVLEAGTTSTEALGKMQEMFAGQAEAYGSTTEGAQKKMDIAFGNLKETVGGYVIPVMAWFAETMSDLATRAIPIVEGAIEAIYPVFQTVFGWVQANVVPILETIIGVVEDNWPMVQTVIEQVLGAVWEVLSTVFGAIATFISENQETIRGIIDTVWNYIKGTVENVIGIIQGIIKTVMALIRGDWSGAWQGIKDVLTIAWDQMKLVIDTALSLIGPLISGAWKAIRSAAETAWLDIQVAVLNAWFSLERKVRERIADVKTAIEDGWRAITTWFEELPAKFAQFGQNIVQGLINGIQGFIGNVQGVIQNLLGSIPEWAKRLLGISSPSTVFFNIGTDMWQGLIDATVKAAPALYYAISQVVKNAISLMDDLNVRGDFGPEGVLDSLVDDRGVRDFGPGGTLFPGFQSIVLPRMPEPEEWNAWVNYGEPIPGESGSDSADRRDFGPGAVLPGGGGGGSSGGGGSRGGGGGGGAAGTIEGFTDLALGQIVEAITQPVVYAMEKIAGEQAYAGARPTDDIRLLRMMYGSAKA